MTPEFLTLAIHWLAHLLAWCAIYVMCAVQIATEERHVG